MTKILFILSILFTFTSAFAQSNSGINLCGNAENSIEKADRTEKTTTQKELLECGELTANNNDLKVNSFTIGMTAGSDYVSLKIKGNKFNGRATTLINKYNPSKIYIEKVQLISNEGDLSTGKLLAIIIQK